MLSKPARITYLENGRAGTEAQGGAFEHQPQRSGDGNLSVATPCLLPPLPAMHVRVAS